MTELTKRGTPRKRQYPTERAKPHETPWERLRRYLAVDPKTDCWVFQGVLRDTGYGALTINGKAQYAHRIAYEEFITEIPAGLQIDHLCRNRACCNPWHLDPVTAKVNTLRGMSVAVGNASKTRCSAGHLYDEVNTRVTIAGRRQCITCTNRRNRERSVVVSPLRIEGVYPHIVRRWAIEHNYNVKDRGALPKAVLRAYFDAHSQAAA